MGAGVKSQVLWRYRGGVAIYINQCQQQRKPETQPLAAKHKKVPVREAGGGVGGNLRILEEGS